MILVAGVLLITPGVITDIVGLALLVPPARYALRKGLQLWLARHAEVQKHLHVQIHTNVPPDYAETARPREANVVEGHIIDAHVVQEDDTRDESTNR